MATNESLILKIATTEDFKLLNRALFLLVLLAAALSPQPVAMAVLALLIAGAGRLSRILCFSKVNKVKLTLFVFADGRVSLRSGCEHLAEGFLNDQQWLTNRVSVLSVSMSGQTRNLVVLPRQQARGEYRRLNVWLRQGAALLLKSEGRV